MAPQFFKIILSPHASKLHIPDDFVIKYGADLRDVVFLEVPSGAIWEVKLHNSNGMRWLKEGWNQFKEYYSIDCGYFLLFLYNGNSHFSVVIFDLSASEIEYPSGPSEGTRPENFVNIVGDASHRNKAGRSETQNNACDDILDGSMRNTSAKVTKVADHSYSKSQKSGSPVSRPSCLPERQEPNRVKLEKPDVEDDLNYAKQKDKRKEFKEKLYKENMEKNLYCAGDKGDEHCKEVVDSSASKMTNTTKCNKRKNSISLEASHCRYPLRSKPMKVMKLEQSKEKGSPSYSGRKKAAVPLSCASALSKRKESNRVKLERPNLEEDFCCSAPKAKREEKLEKKAFKFREHCNEVLVVDPSASKMITTNQRNEKKNATSLESNCRYPLRSKQSKETKLEKGDVQEHCNEVLVVDPSVSKMTNTNQRNKKKNASSLESNCRYPLRSKQLKEVKLEKEDAQEHCNKMPVVDPSATKVSTTNRHHEKKTRERLDIPHCRYPLRSKQLKEVKFEKPDAEEDLLYVAQKAKRKKANNVKLEKGDVEEHCKEIQLGNLSTTKTTTTNRYNEKKPATSLDASHWRYLLRSKQLKQVKLEQWEAGGNMHNITPKDKVVADSPYCKRENSGLTASSPSCQPIRVKLEEPYNLFCATEKAKGQETNNVKLETGDMEGNLNSAAYKDSTASEMTNTWQKKGVTLREAQLANAYFKPQFIVSMQPTYVSKNFQLDLPVNFFKKYIKEEETIVILRVSDGRTWRARLFVQSNCAKIESSGWKDFVLGNNLKEHDTCVFELIDGIEPVLDVSIFPATTCVS